MTTNTGILIYSNLKSYGFNDPLAKFATAQAAHETAVLGIPFKSKIFRSNNNAFGMTYAGQAEAAGEKNGYAYYHYIELSIADFADWYIKHRAGIINFPIFINTLEQYVNFLKKNDYFEDTEENYLKGCQYFYNQLFG